MGEKQNGPFHLFFNASLKVDFQGSRARRETAGEPRERERMSRFVPRCARAGMALGVVSPPIIERRPSTLWVGARPGTAGATTSPVNAL
jgi:hypothetical protein